jgi:hypothetical protein
MLVQRVGMDREFDPLPSLMMDSPADGALAAQILC